MIAGIFILAAGLAALPAVPHPAYVALIMVVLSVGQGFYLPSIMSLISLNVDASKQGNAMGAAQSMASFARIIGPLLGGIIFDLEARWPFWAAAMMMTFSLGWAQMTRRRLVNNHSTQPLASSDKL